MQQASALNILAGGTNSASSTSSSLIAIDGSDYGRNSDNSSSLVTTISTTQSSSLIIVFGAVETGTQVTPHVKDAAGLSWIARTASPIINSAYHAELFEYYAIASAPLSSDHVNVSINLAQNFSVKVFGISGANTNSPFDPGLPTPVQRPGGTTNPTVSVTTSNPNDMILGLAFVSGAPNVTEGAGFSCIGATCGHAKNPVAYGEYQVVSSTQSGYAVSATLSIRQSWIMVADAVVQAASSSSTSVTCSPESVAIGSPTTCTATVTGNNPTGTISWQSSGSGTFSATSCTLSSGSCSVNYTSSSSTSPVTIAATYSGDNNNVAGNPGTYSLTVTIANSSMNLTCSPSIVPAGSSATCTATVSGSSPTGTVTFSSTDPGGKFSPSSACTLSSASCFVTYTPSSTTTPATINASYSGDTNNSPSSKTFHFSLPPPTTTTTTTTSQSTTKPGPTPILSLTLIIAIIAIAVIAIGGAVIGVLVRRRYY